MSIKGADLNSSEILNQKAIETAIEFLQKGELIGLPTETVYGLAARISDNEAIRKIFSTKARPFFDPLIVHISSNEQVHQLVKSWPESADIIANKFWPGPLTIVLEKLPSVSDLITSGLNTVGIRFPKHPMARAIIEGLKEPVAAPSANKFGKTSPSTAKHVIEAFDGSIFVADGGPCDVGIESTIIKLNETRSSVEVTQLRKGSILLNQIQEALRPLNKEVKLIDPGKNIEAPGQVKHHYMPAIPLLLFRKFSDKNPESIQNLEFINQSLKSNYKNPVFLKLSPLPAQAARELYSELRNCSQEPNDLIVFVLEDFHNTEDWSAIQDRLNRAASFKLL